MYSFAGYQLWFFLLACLCLPTIVDPLQAHAQQNEASDNGPIEGEVISVSGSTVVVKGENDQYHLFVVERSTVKPRVIPVHSRVRVTSIGGDEQGSRIATNIVAVESAPTGSGTATPGAPQAEVPAQVKDLEGEIRRGARRYAIGVRAGIGFDPELISFGVQSNFGPIFNRKFSFRPSAEFDFGEITDLVALNLEGTYRLPLSRPNSRWYAYLGAGPSLNFIHQSFQSGPGQGRQIEFGNFDYDTGFNILGGVQYRRGTFVEMKTSLWSHPVPTLRLIVGYNF